MMHFMSGTRIAERYSGTFLQADYAGWKGATGKSNRVMSTAASNVGNCPLMCTIDTARVVKLRTTNTRRRAQVTSNIFVRMQL